MQQVRQSELPPCVTQAVPVAILGDRMRLGVVLRAGEVKDIHASTITYVHQPCAFVFAHLPARISVGDNEIDDSAHNVAQRS